MSLIHYDLSNELGHKALQHDARMMRLAGKRAVVKFVQDSKTERQRGYQWGWFYPAICGALADAGIAIPLKTGGYQPWDSEILHEVLKKQVAKPLLLEVGVIKDLRTPDDKELPQKISTEDLDKPHFSEYIRRCRQFLFDWKGIAVPEPQDGYYAQFEAEMRRAA